VCLNSSKDIILCLVCLIICLVETIEVFNNFSFKTAFFPMNATI